MKPLSSLVCALVFLPFLFSGSIVRAATILDDMPEIGKNYEDPEEEQRSGEAKLVLPPPPQEGDLVRFFPGPTRKGRYFIDQKSLSIGPDRVVRYTLVIEGASGARSVNYEGMRCKEGEVRVYAFARADGTWSISTRSQWRRIVLREQNAHHAALGEDYFCPDGVTPGSVAEIVKRLGSKESDRWRKDELDNYMK